MKNYYEEINKKIFDTLKEGDLPIWIKGFSTGSIVSHTSGKGYSFLNSLILSECGEYITFNAALKEGTPVKKGAKSKCIYFYDVFVPKEERCKPSEEQKRIPYLKRINVFNINDCEYATPKWKRSVPQENLDVKPDAKAHEIIDGYLKRDDVRAINMDVATAHYSVAEHKVVIPSMKRFDSKEAYYSTLFHELVHSTSKHLKRELGKKFGSDPYAREELVAEIGSCYLMSICGMECSEAPTETEEKIFRNSVAYIEGWRKSCKEDEKLFVKACSQAEKAVDYILGRLDEDKN